ncbi:MAG: hypothetical protein Q9160_000625 [Pyrenula sp. 1 TL-2023]
MEGLDKRLPADRAGDTERDKTNGREPWLLHALDVSALNFCAFAMCEDRDQGQDAIASTSTNGLSGSNANAIDQPPSEALQEADLTSATRATPPTRTLLSTLPNIPIHNTIFLATPNSLSSGAIDIFALPSSRRVSTIPALGSPLVKETGMLMAVGIAFIPHSLSESASESSSSSQNLNTGTDHPSPQLLTVVAGYESGHVAVHMRQPLSPSPTQLQTTAGPRPASPLISNANTNTTPPQNQIQTWTWTTTYLTNPHTQPVLSLCISLAPLHFITSAADAILASHPIPLPPLNPHNEQRPQIQVQNTPIQTLKTGHAGQQSLTLRSDGRLCATAGWDGRVRVYGTGSASASTSGAVLDAAGQDTRDGQKGKEDSTANAENKSKDNQTKKGNGKSEGMKELAVLKWHREACYAVAFAEILPSSNSPSPPLHTSFTGASTPADAENTPADEEVAKAAGGAGTQASLSMSTSTSTSTSTSALSRIRSSRAQQARQTHWVATGAKEGRVSLWDVY